MELLEHFSINEIIIGIILLALAIKGTVSFIQWAIKEINAIFKKKNINISIHQKMDERLNKHDEKIAELINVQKDILNKIENLSSDINLLLASDKDDIKSYITEKHHYFCYVQQWIDDYSLDCLEKRFSHYKEEGGNSFIENLMKELRSLPKEEYLNIEKKE